MSSVYALPTTRYTDASIQLLNTKTSFSQSPLFFSTSSQSFIPASFRNKAEPVPIFPPASLSSTTHHRSAHTRRRSNQNSLHTAFGASLRPRRRSFQRSAQERRTSQTSENSRNSQLSFAFDPDRLAPTIPFSVDFIHVSYTKHLCHQKQNIVASLSLC